MAWKAEVKAVKTPTERDEFVIDVWYYDDAAPATVLASQSFTFSAGMTVTELRADVIARGKQLRSLIQARDARAAQLVGQVVAIP